MEGHWSRSRPATCATRPLRDNRQRTQEDRIRGGGPQRSPMPESLTQLLAAITDGDRSSMDRFLPTVYDELRALARSLLAHERTGHTLQPTALVHEVYLKLINQSEARSQDRTQFFSLAAVAMRRILVDHARTRAREKRGGGRKVTLDTGLLIAD